MSCEQITRSSRLNSSKLFDTNISFHGNIVASQSFHRQINIHLQPVRAFAKLFLKCYNFKKYAPAARHCEPCAAWGSNPHYKLKATSIRNSDGFVPRHDAQLSNYFSKMNEKARDEIYYLLISISKTRASIRFVSTQKTNVSIFLFKIPYDLFLRCF
jgi:hypothetical protein